MVALLIDTGLISCLLEYFVQQNQQQEQILCLSMLPTMGFCTRIDIMAATIMIVPVILMRLLIALAFSRELPGRVSL